MLPRKYQIISNNNLKPGWVTGATASSTTMLPQREYTIPKTTATKMATTTLPLQWKNQGLHLFYKLKLQKCKLSLTPGLETLPRNKGPNKGYCMSYIRYCRRVKSIRTWKKTILWNRTWTWDRYSWSATRRRTMTWIQLWSLPYQHRI